MKLLVTVEQIDGKKFDGDESFDYEYRVSVQPEDCSKLEHVASRNSPGKAFEAALLGVTLEGA